MWRQSRGGRWSILMCGLALLGCGEQGASNKNQKEKKSKASVTDPAARKAIAGADKKMKASASKGAAAKPSTRRAMETWSALGESVWRAAVEARGLTIDLGTPDQFKYTRGGWGGAWGPLDDDGQGVTFSVPKAGAQVHTGALPGAITRVQVRARSITGGGVKITGPGGLEVASALNESWSVISAEVPAGALGPQGATLTFAPKGKGIPEIDWLWLGVDGEAAPPLPPRLVPLRLGKRTRRALPAPTPRAYVFHTVAPEGASLVVDYGARQPTAFTVEVTDGVKTAREAAESGDGEWHELVVPMAGFAGQAVQITLRTEKGEGVAGFGEPEIMVPALPEGIVLESPAKKVIVAALEGEAGAKLIFGRATAGTVWPHARGALSAEAAMQAFTTARYSFAQGEGQGLAAALEANEVPMARFDADKLAEVGPWLKARKRGVALAHVAPAEGQSMADAVSALLGEAGTARSPVAVVLTTSGVTKGQAPTLLIYPRGGVPHGRSEVAPVEALDVPATVMDLLGLAPIKGGQGQSMLAWLDDRPVAQPAYALGTLGEGGREVMVGSWRCAATDPGSSLKVSMAREGASDVGRFAVARRLCEVMLGEGLARPAKGARQGLEGGGASAAGGAAMDPELKKQLEALGYFGDD